MLTPTRTKALTPALALVLLVGCGPGHVVDRGDAPEGAASTAPEVPWFTEASAQTGLAFVHFNGMTGEFYYPEVIAPGVALFDYDRDGDVDVFLVQGQSLGRGRPLFPPADPRPLKGRLFRNDLQIQADGTSSVRFTDVTEASGIEATEYGMGVAVGDYDNDGCPDLYVTALGRNQLFRNSCRGTFTEVSRRSGVDDDGWSVSAAFVDFDRDGWLDLFVGHYLNWTLDTNTPCYGNSGKRVYCAPRVYRAQPSRLYRNNGNGTFTDVTRAAGLATQFGPALGVVTADFNADGWIDMYVANDGEENQLWMNRQNGTFTNMAVLAGAALSPQGKPKAGMGVDAGDFDGNGTPDLIVANLAGEGHDLYVNDGSGSFENRSASSGFGYLSLPYTGFGTAWFDVDQDGRLDVLTVNGAVQTIEAQAGEAFPLRQRKQLFHNLGNGRFEDATDRGGPALAELEVSRGAAFGDLDNDGDTDVIVANNNGPARVLLNTVGAGGDRASSRPGTPAADRPHWLGLRLVGHGGRDMLGAQVVIGQSGQPTRWRRARADGSYASANDPRVLVGLGSATGPVRVRVTWPNGQSEEWPQVDIDRYTTLVEGSSR